MKLLDFALLMTMPIWLPSIIFGTIFMAVLCIPVALYGPLWIIGTLGIFNTALAVVGIPGAYLVSRMLRKIPWASFKGTSYYRLPDSDPTQKLATIECPRCHNMDATNLKGGKFSCTLCSFQKT